MLPNDIIKYAAFMFRVDPAEVRGSSRKACLCRVRFALYLGLYKRQERKGLGKRSLSLIGRWMNRDHSSVINGLKRAQPLYESDKLFAEAVDAIARLTEEIACNQKLLMAHPELQQRMRSSMEHPEHTEAVMNEHLAKGIGKSIQVYWDGGVIEASSPARFDLYIRDEDTDTAVLIGPDGFEVVRTDSLVPKPIAKAMSYKAAVSRIRALVADGRIAAVKEAA